MKLLTQLTEMHNFTSNEKIIAAYILANKESSLHLSIQELAKASYTSHSAVIRLTQKLGLSGFKEFKIRLAQDLQQDIQNISNVDPNYPFGLNESSIQVAKEIAELMKATIDKSYTLMDNELLFQAARLLNQADRIFIYASGDSQIRARSFQNKLYKINKYVVIATELSEWAYHTVNLTPRDCALFVTYHARASAYLKAARHFDREHIPFITITAADTSELAKLSKICIRVANDEVRHAKIGTFSSQIAFDYVLNVLYSCMYKIDYLHNKQAAAQSLKMFLANNMADEDI